MTSLYNQNRLTRTSLSKKPKTGLSSKRTTPACVAATLARENETGRVRTEEYWPLAQKQQFSNGRSAVVVPLTNGYEPATAFLNESPQAGKPLDVAGHFIQTKLLIYKDDKGGLRTEQLQIIPTAADRSQSSRVKAASFSGYVLRLTGDGRTPLTGLTYHNGKLRDVYDYQRQRSGGRQEGTCSYVISRKYEGDPPAELGSGGGGSSSTGYISFGGSYYELSVYSAPCPAVEGGGGGGGSGGGGGGGGGGYGTLPQQDPSGGGGFFYPGAPMYEDGGGLNSSAAYNFIYAMQNVRNPAIFFDADEQTYLRANPTIIAALRDYIEEYGEKPDGSKAFRLSASDQQNYPKFTDLVKNLPSFVEQHERVKNALTNHTNLPWSKMKVLLKFGSGPKLMINELGRSTYYGHTIYPAFPEGFIEINASYVRGLEAANLNATREATAFLLTVTLLHEITHYGAVDGGRSETRSNEFGNDFEREILGTTITRNNAGQLLVEFNKLN